jgi:hypothetical protein
VIAPRHRGLEVGDVDADDVGIESEVIALGENRVVAQRLFARCGRPD